MTLPILYKLLALVAIVALGWVVGRLRWLGDESADPARVLSNAAFYLFAPALFFRATARVDLAHLPWGMLSAFFLPVVGVMLGVYGWQKWRAGQPGHDGAPVAAPAVRAITASFGNSVQIGIPLAAGILGEAGLGLHLTLVSVHALVLLLVVTSLVEMDLARARADGAAGLGQVLLGTARNALIHPVVLPVLVGLAWNLTGLGLAEPVDEVLQVLGSAVVPLCLTLIGMSLAYLGLPKSLAGALTISGIKLLLQPALVLAVAWGVFGLRGLTLSVLVLMASLPAGSNALMFAQRYRALEGETAAVNVLSTLAFVAVAPFWLWVLSLLH